MKNNNVPNLSKDSVANQNVEKQKGSLRIYFEECKVSFSQRSENMKVQFYGEENLDLNPSNPKLKVHQVKRHRMRKLNDLLQRDTRRSVKGESSLLEKSQEIKDYRRYNAPRIRKKDLSRNGQYDMYTDEKLLKKDRLGKAYREERPRSDVENKLKEELKNKSTSKNYSYLHDYQPYIDYMEDFYRTRNRKRDKASFAKEENLQQKFVIDRKNFKVEPLTEEKAIGEKEIKVSNLQQSLTESGKTQLLGTIGLLPEEVGRKIILEGEAKDTKQTVRQVQNNVVGEDLRVRKVYNSQQKDLYVYDTLQCLMSVEEKEKRDIVRLKRDLGAYDDNSYAELKERYKFHQSEGKKMLEEEGIVLTKENIVKDGQSEDFGKQEVEEILNVCIMETGQKVGETDREKYGRDDIADAFNVKGGEIQRGKSNSSLILKSQKERIEENVEILASEYPGDEMYEYLTPERLLYENYRDGKGLGKKAYRFIRISHFDCRKIAEQEIEMARSKCKKKSDQIYLGENQIGQLVFMGVAVQKNVLVLGAQFGEGGPLEGYDVEERVGQKIADNEMVRMDLPAALQKKEKKDGEVDRNTYVEVDVEIFDKVRKINEGLKNENELEHLVNTIVDPEDRIDRVRSKEEKKLKNEYDSIRFKFRLGHRRSYGLRQKREMANFLLEHRGVESGGRDDSIVDKSLTLSPGTMKYETELSNFIRKQNKEAREGYERNEKSRTLTEGAARIRAEEKLLVSGRVKRKHDNVLLARGVPKRKTFATTLPKVGGGSEFFDLSQENSLYTDKSEVKREDAKGRLGKGGLTQIVKEEVANASELPLRGQGKNLLPGEKVEVGERRKYRDGKKLSRMKGKILNRASVQKKVLKEPTEGNSPSVVRDMFRGQTKVIDSTPERNPYVVKREKMLSDLESSKDRQRDYLVKTVILDNFVKHNQIVPGSREQKKVEEKREVLKENYRVAVERKNEDQNPTQTKSVLGYYYTKSNVAKRVIDSVAKIVLSVGEAGTTRRSTQTIEMQNAVTQPLKTQYEEEQKQPSVQNIVEETKTKSQTRQIEVIRIQSRQYNKKVDEKLKTYTNIRKKEQIVKEEEVKVCHKDVVVVKERKKEVVEKENNLYISKKSVDVDLTNYKIQIVEKYGEDMQRNVVEETAVHSNLQRVSSYKASRNEEEKEVQSQVVEKLKKEKREEKVVVENIGEQNSDLEFVQNVTNKEVNEEEISQIVNKQLYLTSTDVVNKDKKYFQNSDMYEFVTLEEPRKVDSKKSPFFKNDRIDEYGQNLLKTVRGKMLVYGEVDAEIEERVFRDLLCTTYFVNYNKSGREVKDSMRKKKQRKFVEVSPRESIKEEFQFAKRAKRISKKVVLDSMKVASKNFLAYENYQMLLDEEEAYRDDIFEFLMIGEGIKKDESLDQYEVQTNKEYYESIYTALKLRRVYKYRRQKKHQQLQGDRSKFINEKEVLRKSVTYEKGAECLPQSVEEPTEIFVKHERHRQPLNSQKQNYTGLMKNVELQIKQKKEQQAHVKKERERDLQQRNRQMSRIDKYTRESGTELNLEIKKLELALKGLALKDGEEVEVISQLDGQREERRNEGQKILQEKIGMKQRTKSSSVPEATMQLLEEQDQKNRRVRNEEEKFQGLILNHGYQTMVGNRENTGNYGYLGRRSDAVLSGRTDEVQQNVYRISRKFIRKSDDRDFQGERSEVERNARTEVRTHTTSEMMEGNMIRRGQMNVAERIHDHIRLDRIYREINMYNSLDSDVDEGNQQMRREVVGTGFAGFGRQTLNRFSGRENPQKEKVEFSDMTFLKVEEEVNNRKGDMVVMINYYDYDEEHSEKQKEKIKKAFHREEQQKKFQAASKFMSDVENETVENISEETKNTTRKSYRKYGNSKVMMLNGESKESRKEVQGRQNLVKTIVGGGQAGQGVIRDGEIMSMFTFLFEMGVLRTGEGKRTVVKRREADNGQRSIGQSGINYVTFKVLGKPVRMVPGRKREGTMDGFNLSIHHSLERARQKRTDINQKIFKDPKVQYGSLVYHMYGGGARKKKVPISILEQDREIVYYGGSRPMQTRYYAALRDQRRRMYARKFWMNRAVLKISHRQISKQYVHTVLIPYAEVVRTQLKRSKQMIYLKKDGLITEEVYDRFSVIQKNLNLIFYKNTDLQFKFIKRQRNDDQKIRMEHGLLMAEMLRKAKMESIQQQDYNALGKDIIDQDLRNRAKGRKVKMKQSMKDLVIRAKAEATRGKIGRGGISPTDFAIAEGGVVGSRVKRNAGGRKRDQDGYHQEVVGYFLSRTGEHVLKTEEMLHVTEKRGEMFGKFLSPCAFYSVDTECETIPHVNYKMQTPVGETKYESFTVFSRGFHRGGSRKFGEYCQFYEEEELQNHTNKLRQEISSVKGMRVLPRMQLIFHAKNGEMLKQKFDQGRVEQQGLYNPHVLTQESAFYSQMSGGKQDKRDYLSLEVNYDGREFENQVREEWYNDKHEPKRQRHVVPGKYREKKNKKKGNKQIMKQGGSVVDVTNQAYRLVKDRPSRTSGLRTRKQTKFIKPYSDNIEEAMKKEQNISLSETRGERKEKGVDLTESGRRDLKEFKPEFTTPDVLREDKRNYQYIVERSRKDVVFGTLIGTPEMSLEGKNLVEKLGRIRRGGDMKPMMEQLDKDGITRMRLGKRVEGQKEVRLKDPKTSRVKLVLEPLREIKEGGRRRRVKHKQKR